MDGSPRVTARAMVLFVILRHEHAISGDGQPFLVVITQVLHGIHILEGFRIELLGDELRIDVIRQSTRAAVVKGEDFPFLHSRQIRPAGALEVGGDTFIHDFFIRTEADGHRLRLVQPFGTSEEDE